jgi:hypothetical protein
LASKRKPSSRSADLAAASDEGAAVTVSQGAVSLELSVAQRIAAGTYDILFDGEPAGQVVIDKPCRSITVPLPPNRLPTTVGLVDAATGRRPFAAPLALDAACTPLVDRATIGDAALSRPPKIARSSPPASPSRRMSTPPAAASIAARCHSPRCRA